jgi:pyrrolysine biosynthesis protein PylC
MLAAIAGGRLQGVELTCLARKAGWQTLLLDRDPRAPARPLSDGFRQLDLLSVDALDEACAGVDILIPAIENRGVLSLLSQWGQSRKIPVAFDMEAYALTCSKTTSNWLIADLGIPLPAPWPACGYPAVAKPDRASGSERVLRLNGEGDLLAAFPDGMPDRGWVIQQYLEGPSFSLEVIGRPGRYVPLVCTDLHMDAAHDCKAVTTPCTLTAGQLHELDDIGVALAEAIQLKGLMDLEVILHDGKFKVLEIDARFPSQTPLAVHAATGANLLGMLADLFLFDKTPQRPSLTAVRGVRFEHIRVTPQAIFVEGEHIMAQAGPLERVTAFQGADEALTNYREGAEEWVATLIVSAETREHADRRRNRVLTAIQDRFAIPAIVDRSPGEAP